VKNKVKTKQTKQNKTKYDPRGFRVGCRVESWILLILVDCCYFWCLDGVEFVVINKLFLEYLFSYKANRSRGDNWLDW
jgi:hypothetical protein